jgi:hypothetical protein
MCGTINDARAQSCTFCGYLFEDYGTGTVSPPKAESQVVSDSAPASPPSPMEQNPAPSASYTSPIISGGAPLFLVSKSLLSTVIPSLIYLVFIGFVGLSSGFSIYTIVLIVFFLIVALVPALLAPRRFEFYDDSLKIQKTIGGTSETPYSGMTLLDSPARGRSQQIVLSVTGQRRAIVIPKNPTNQNLNMDLKQFLTGKLKKPVTPGNSPGPTGTSDQHETGDEGANSTPTL